LPDILPSRQNGGKWYRAERNETILYFFVSPLTLTGIQLNNGENLSGIAIQFSEFNLFLKQVKSSDIYLINPTSYHSSSAKILNSTEQDKLTKKIIEYFVKHCFQVEETLSPFRELS